MLRGGKLQPIPAYFVIAFGDAFIFTFGENILILFQTNEAGLSAGQLLALSAVSRAIILIFEIPTGVVADTVGRKASICTGFVLMGAGLLVSGAQAEFSTLLAGSALLGFGFTFLSGARQAWIADEVGVEEANPVYLRTAQLSMWFWVAAVPASVLLSAAQINLPILIAGAVLVVLGLTLSRVMPEEGFQRPSDGLRVSLSWVKREIRENYLNSRSAFRGRPVLITILLIAVMYGVVGLGFQRLWLLHFNLNIGYPDTFGLDAVGWFGVLRVASALLGVLLLEIARRGGIGMMRDHSLVIRALFLINTLQLGAILLLALTSSFELAFLAYCATFALSYAFDPFWTAWINQNASSNVRATVISVSSQAESVGRISSAPVIGLVAAATSVRAALTVTGLVMTIPLLLYLRASGQAISETAKDDV